jgi:hypothetical protein
MGSVPEVLLAYISSVIPAQLLSSDLVVDPADTAFRNTHLKVISALSLARHLGETGPTYQTLITPKIKALLRLAWQPGGSNPTESTRNYIELQGISSGRNERQRLS